ncbi:MAG TPA: SRPBCC family protein, partial [Alphaproteobacteria bacterium]|nr:SRPBCC family protein [Alphaproteobacteria bacterium]
PAYDFSNAEVRMHAVWWLWPNVCFLRYPGSGNMMVLHIVPVALDHTVETYDFYFLDATPNPQQWQAIRYIDEVLQPEDIAIVESVHQGLRSKGYRDGRLMVSDRLGGEGEHGVHHFHSLLAQALGA